MYASRVVAVVVVVVVVVIALPVSRIALLQHKLLLFFKTGVQLTRGRQQAQYRRVSLLGCNQTM